MNDDKYARDGSVVPGKLTRDDMRAAAMLPSGGELATRGMPKYGYGDVALLASLHPWPAARPDLAFDPHGWCQPEHREHIAPFLSAATGLVVELGSWLGQSTRLLLELAPNAVVACVDTWEGSADMSPCREARSRIAAGRLYEQFLANQWDHRRRVIPIREDSCVGLRSVLRAGLKPDLIYFDTAHTYEQLTRELEVARLFFPAARLYGDDWGTCPEDVRPAVEAFARKHYMTPHGSGNAWVLLEEGEEIPCQD